MLVSSSVAVSPTRALFIDEREGAGLGVTGGACFAFWDDASFSGNVTLAGASLRTEEALPRVMMGDVDGDRS